jgi:DNA polymerase-3 subunit gamma/tau
MSYKVLALKYRPQTFTAVVGQQPTLLALQHALDNQQIHHAYLFTGTRGVGKTTLARILAKSLNCEQGISSKPCGVCAMCTSITCGENPDVIEIDAASRTKVEDTRDLLDNVPYAPVQARFKIYIIDEVHMLSNHSFNALLKTLEEPPEHVKFILATTDPQKLPVTVLSRCLQFHLKHLTLDQIAQHLAVVLQQEQINYEAAALNIIAQSANGSMRDALSLLEQVIAFGERTVSVVAAQQTLGTSVRAQTLQLLSKIIAGDAMQVITLVRELHASNFDFNQVLKTLQGLIHQLALIQVVPQSLDATLSDSEQLQQLAQQADPVDLQLYYQTSLLGVRDLPYAPDLATGFEMIVLRMLAFHPLRVGAGGGTTTVTHESRAAGAASAAAPIASTARATAEPAASTAARVPHNVPQTAPITANAPATTVASKVERDVAAPIPNQHSAISHTSNTLNWGDIITRLNLTGLTKVVAENCTVTQWSNEQITLTLQENQRALLNAKHTERIQAALQEYLGTKAKLTINIGATNIETPAAQGLRLQKAAHSAAEQAIRADLHIQQMEQTFDAKIIDVIL